MAAYKKVVFWVRCPLHRKQPLDTCYLCKTARDVNGRQADILDREKK